MKATVILAHPYEKSFNHAIYKQIIRTFRSLGINVYAHDLYEENFNPVLSRKELGKEPAEDLLVQQYLSELLESEYLVFVHPNWWGQPPAIMTGYIDRVMRPPFTYDFPENDSGGGLPLGKLAGKTGLVFNTSNTEETRENGYFGDPLENIWKKCVFGFCGIQKYHRTMFRIIADSTNEDRTNWLKKTETSIIEIVSDNPKTG